MSQLLRLWPYVWRVKWRFSVAWICMLTASAFVMASPLLVGVAVDFGLKPVRDANGGGIIGLDGNKTLVVAAALGLIAFAIGRGLAAFGQQYIGESTAQRIAYDIRNQIYDNLQNLSYAYHDKLQTGQVMSRATQDVENLRMFMNMGALRLVYVVLLIVVATVGMFIISWQLALVSLATMPVIIIRSIIVSARMRPIWMKIQQSQAVVTQVAEEGLSGIRVVKAFSQEPHESRKFYEVSKEQADLSYAQATEMAKHGPLMQGLSAFQIALTVGVGAFMIADGTLGVGDLLTFTLWLNLLQMPIRSIGFIVGMFSRAISSAERVFELIDAQSAVEEKPDAVELESPEGDVQFEGVSFGYDNVSAVLSDLDIDAPSGKVIALLGPTGSGKSTVVNLIPRFYDVTGGKITIDGTDVRDMKIDSLRRHIGIVQQDVFLFIGTIAENIAYGKPEATMEEIEAVAKAARIHDFIVSLPGGYNEWVGERGVTLSGGQQQRIAIARTLLLDPRILIFDDSTSSVDTQTEVLIQAALNALMEGRTTFVIAQRLRTVMRADEIIVLDGGRVAQRGKHADLLQEDGLYRRIYDLELKDQEDALSDLKAGETRVTNAVAGGGS